MAGEFLNRAQIYPGHYKATDRGVWEDVPGYVLQCSILLYGFLHHKLKPRPRRDLRFAISSKANLWDFGGPPFLQFFNRLHSPLGKDHDARSTVLRHEQKNLTALQIDPIPFERIELATSHSYFEG